MKKRIKQIAFVAFLALFLCQSCGVATKNKRRTVTIVECYDQKLFDKRKKYSKLEKDIEQKNRKYLKKQEKDKDY
jgi:hypothetical protein